MSLVACGGGEATTAEDEEATETASERAEDADKAKTVEQKEQPDPLTPAEQLAADVLERAGASDLSDAKEIRFTFVVSTKDEVVFRARHRFNRVANTDRVTWVNPDSPVGKRFDLLIDLDDKHVEGKVDGEPITDGQRKKVRPIAYQRWVNDYYWYAMPLKLRDPGVNLTKLPQRQWKDQTYDVLEMTFSGVGLTPGDRYILYVHPELDRIERWDMDLQASDGEPVQVARTNFEQVGPLYLSHDHVWLNGDKRVDIRNVSVSDTVENKEFSFDDSDFVYDAFPDLDANGDPVEAEETNATDKAENDDQ
jgi:hypothetical protein